MFLPLSVQWLPAWLQLTQNGAGGRARRDGRGVMGSEGANGRRGKVGKERERV